MTLWQQTYPRGRFILYGLAAVCLSVLLLGRVILFPVIKSSLIDYLAREHHLVIKEVELGGSLVGGLHLAKIKAARNDNSSVLAKLTIDSLQVDYSLFDMLQGMDTFLANTRITMDKGDFVLDLAATEGNSPITVVLPQHLPRIVGRNLSLALLHGDNKFLLAGCDFSAESVVSGQGQPLLFVSKSVSVVSSGGKSLQSSGSISCWYRPESLVLQQLVLNGEDIRATGKFLLGKDGGPSVFAMELHVLDGDLTASGTLGPETSEFSLRLAALELAKIAPFLPTSEFALSGKVSGKAEAKIGADGVVGTLESAWKGTLNGETADLSCQGSLQKEALVLHRLAGKFAGNQLTLTDGVVPLADLGDLQRFISAVSVGHFAARLENIPALWKIAGKSPQGIALPATHLFELEGKIKEKRLVLTRGKFESRKNSLTLNQGTMQLPGVGQSFATQPLSGDFRFALTDMKEIASLVDLPEMGGSLQGRMDISGTLQAPAGHITVQGEKLRFQGCPVGDLRLEAKADGKQVRVISAQVKQGDDALRFSGRYSLTRQVVESLEGELSIKELDRYGAACKAMIGDLSGNLHILVTRAVQGRQQISLRFRNGHFAALAVAKGALVLETEDWRNFACKEAELETSQGGLSLSGLIVADFARQSVTAKLQQLALSRGGARFTAEKPFVLKAFYGGNKSLAIDSLMLRSPVGSLSASGHLSQQEEGNFQLKATGFKSGAWLKGLVAPGYDFTGLDLNLSIKGPLSRGRGSLVGSVAALRIPRFAEPFVGGIDVDYSPEGVRVKKFALNNAVGQQLSVSGRIPYNPFAGKSFLAGPFSLNGLIKLPGFAEGAVVQPGSGTVAGELVAEVNLSGSWQQPEGRATIRAKNLSVPQLQGVLPPEPINLDCALHLTGRRLQLQRCKFDSASVHGTLSGEWGQLPSLPSFLSRSSAGLPGVLAVRGNLKMADIGWLAGESKALRRLSGRLSSAFSVSGSAVAPKLSGELTVDEGSLRFSRTSFPGLDGVSLRADFFGETVQIRSVEGLLGGAPFHADGNLVLAGAETRFDLTATGKNVLLYRDADLKIRGDADLHLRGPLSKLGLSGKIIITDGRYTKNIDFLRLFRGTAKPRSDIGLQVFSLPDPPFRDMELDIKVSSAQPFLLRNNLAKGHVRPVFRLGGTGEVPALVGRIFIDPSNISLPAGRLAIESGVITFPENDPDHPTFDLTAKSRMAGYDIDMQVQGTAEEPVITLSSQPALSDSDLLLLVLTGRPPVNGKGTGRRQVAGMNMAVYLGKGLLANWFGLGATESDESVLERFDLDIGRQITSSGEDTVEAQFRLVEGLLLPGDRLFLTSERDVYDNYNVGVKIVFRFK